MAGVSAQGPYARAAAGYRERGWPNPIPVKGKHPPVEGFTGRAGADVTPGQLRAWATGKEGGWNIGLRLQDGIVGLDVDAYDGKQGAATIAKAAAELGELPATWSTTARGGDQPARILLFRTPTGRDWSAAERHLGRFGPHVNVLHRGWRYAMVAPSVHPRVRRSYRWYDPAGKASGKAPGAEDLAELPTAWVAFLTAPGPAPAEEDTGDRGRPAVEQDHDEPIPVGQRRATLLTYAGRLRARGLTLDEAEVLFRRRWEQCAQPAGDPAPWERYRAELADVYERYKVGPWRQEPPPVASSNGSRDRAVAIAGGSPALGGLLEAMGAYLYLDDPDHVLVALAVAVSAELDGPPLWVMLVGAPSGGKTEAIEVLRGRGAHLDELTNAGLLGWQFRKGKATPPIPGGALVRLGRRGLLTISDMSTLLAREQRSGATVDQLFANLRRVHDGHLSRDITPPPGAIGELRWEGRATLLAACTPAIDRFAGHAEQLGPRWVYFRLRRPSRDTQRRRQRKVHTAGQLEDARATARRLAGQLVDQAVPLAQQTTIGEELAERIFDAAQLTCWGRGAVPRHGYGRREIDGFPVVEDTPRVTWQLLMLARCLLALGQDQAETLRLVRRAALGSMPEGRRSALGALAGGVAATGRELARTLRCDVGVAIRTAEDLAALALLEWPDDEDLDEQGRPFPQAKYWRLTPDDDRRDLIESVLDERAFCLLAPVAEVDNPQPPSPQEGKAKRTEPPSLGSPLSTSATGLTSGDDPPPLTDADDPERLFAPRPAPGQWSA